MVARPFLKTFIPEGAADIQSVTTLETELRAAWEKGREEGFREGAEASAKAHAESQDQIRGALVENLRDGAQSRAEMQAAVLKSLWPVVTALVEKLAPELAAAGFGDRALSLIRRAIASRPDLKPRLHCAPEARAGLEASLAEHAGIAEIIEDTRLTPLEAELHWDDGFDQIDLTKALNRIVAELHAAKPGAAELAAEAPATDTGRKEANENVG